MPFPPILDVGTMTLAEGFRMKGASSNDFTGAAIAGPEDIDGDGLDDLLIGSPFFDDPNAYNGGAVHIVRGGAGTRPDLDFASLAETDGLELRGSQADANLGWSVGGTYNEVVPSYWLVAPRVGAAYQIGDKALVKANYALYADQIGAGLATITNPVGYNYAYAYFADTTGGDVNGDGIADLGVGIPGEIGQPVGGVCYVVFGDSDDPPDLIALAPELADDFAIAIFGDATYDRFGISLSICEDFNGDGLDDIVMGAPDNDAGGSSAGAVYIVFGAAGLADVDVTGLGSRPADGLVIVGEDAGDRAGYDVSSCGDFDGDGYGDLIVGARGNGEGGANAGAAYVIFGRPGPGATIDLGNLAGMGFKIVGDAAGNRAGQSVSGLGDVNGDGYDDVIVGAPNAGPNAGRAYVIFGRPTSPGTIDLTSLGFADGFRIDAGNSNDQLGQSVAAAGDFNGDGFDDILVGAPSAFTVGSRTGAAYLIYGSATSASTTNSASNDVLAGTATDDLIDASAGGDDSANGGAGNDGLYFGASLTAADRANGGNGSNDQVGLEGNYTGDQRLLLTASMFDDIEVLAVLPGFDYDLTTVDGNVAAGGLLTVFAGNLGPDDMLLFNGSAETNGAFRVFGGQGIDIVTTGAGNDTILFGPGKFNPLTDRVDGGTGANDELLLDGHYTLTLDGTAIQNIDTVTLRRGVTGDLADYHLTVANSLVGAGLTMFIEGTGLDTVLTVDGSAEADGNLVLRGGNLADVLTGGGGDDVLDGGGGNDVLAGLGGSDAFAFTTALGAGNVDSISGFSVPDDTIRLENAVFTGLAAGVLAAGAFNTGAAASQADDRIIYDSATGTLLFDADGNGAGAAIQFATLAGGLAMTASEFLVI
jgi:hypothetical protein